MIADLTVHARAALFAAAIIVAAVPPVQAQPAMQFPSRSTNYADIVAPPPLTPADMMNYCVYDNRVYSLGAGLCIGRTPYVCIPSPGPSTGNRAYWASKEDQVFLRPICN